MNHSLKHFAPHLSKGIVLAYGNALPSMIRNLMPSSHSKLNSLLPILVCYRRHCRCFLQKHSIAERESMLQTLSDMMKADQLKIVSWCKFDRWPLPREIRLQIGCSSVVSWVLLVGF